MDLATASALLGIAVDAEWVDVRRAHRAAIRIAHPDLSGGSADHAAQLNQALEVMRARPQVPPIAPAAVVTLRADESLVHHLADAGHDVGHVVFVDPGAGMLEIIVGEGRTASQLAVSVGEAIGGETPVTFTLDALGTEDPPPIREVVAELMAALRRGD